jgi:hypothetical protein
VTQPGTSRCWSAPPVQPQICNDVPSAEPGPAASRHRLELVPPATAARRDHAPASCRAAMSIPAEVRTPPRQRGHVRRSMTTAAARPPSARGSPTGSQRPQPPSQTGPRTTWSDGTSSHVRHHLSTQRNRLTVKQVHWEPVVGLAGPRGIGGTIITGQVVAVITGTRHPEPITPARPTVAAPGSARLPSLQLVPAAAGAGRPLARAGLEMPRAGASGMSRPRQPEVRCRSCRSGQSGPAERLQHAAMVAGNFT